MYRLSRRAALKALAASPCFIPAVSRGAGPQYSVNDAKIELHCTVGYPKRWKQVYQNTLDHFSERWGRVGPVHVFLIENADWDPEKTKAENPPGLKESQQHLKRLFCKLQGQDSDGEHLDWRTGNHWMSWSIRPTNLMITMTMSPYRAPEQFVIGPIHEYLHAYQTVHGYPDEAIQGNQMGHSRWTGPAWWREGSSVLVAALYSYQHPELFDKLKRPFSWSRFSHEMNRNLELYQKAKTSLRLGVTHDDWQQLEQKKLVHQVIYAGGSVACALLLKKAESLENFMKFFPLVPTLGWRKAFETHFETELAEFYRDFEEQTRSAKVRRSAESPSEDWFGFLKSIE